jgi:hypothetical protein
MIPIFFSSFNYSCLYLIPQQSFCQGYQQRKASTKMRIQLWWTLLSWFQADLERCYLLFLDGVVFILYHIWIQGNNINNVFMLFLMVLLLSNLWYALVWFFLAYPACCPLSFMYLYFLSNLENFLLFLQIFFLSLHLFLLEFQFHIY